MTKEAEKTTKSEATRARLLALALTQFAEKGYDAASMRDLATAADLSPGAFYYHFKSKEEIVQVYYETTFDVFIGGAERIVEETKKFEERLSRTLKFRLETFAENRELVIALSRAAVDPRSELSPFSEGTRDIRERTISAFERMIEGSDLKADAALFPYLPTLFWMFMMSTVFFWVFDKSPNQTKTIELIDKLTPLICRLVRFSRLPFTGGVITPIVDLLESMLPQKK